MCTPKKHTGGVGDPGDPGDPGGSIVPCDKPLNLLNVNYDIIIFTIYMTRRPFYSHIYVPKESDDATLHRRVKFLWFV